MIKKTAFTLIELIFSMVIIAIAFTVFPKILQLATKVSVQNVKEEAMFNAVAYIGLIKSTAWDENNTVSNDILITSNGDSSYDCNTSSGYRAGGFIGSRNCEDNLSASALGIDSDDNGFHDDMDDFSAIDVNNDTDSRDYNLTVNVNYVTDIALNSETFSSSSASATTNTKEINVTVEVNKKTSALGDSFVKISFISNNIGQQQINRRSWQ
ncbi:hypothetical protein MNB_SM-6-1081 [hydrothermal vent metagenome]|uniref:Uncharacterized protein n=1 Tax=hydrothermal vent metagenome TaxID=652676 RepID=A0A1W1CT54_9ZZZZ